jgi:hypothetical protein
MYPYLPLELIEAIIEEIECRETLAACCLVCRAWAPIAQSRYFGYLRFGSSPDKATRFLEVIRESPHIALFPRSIRSNQRGIHLAQIAPLLVNVSSFTLEGVNLAQIAPLLLNLSSFTLEGVNLLYYSSQNAQRIAEAFPSLRELHLDHCTVNLHILSSFFQSHPTLRTLTFRSGQISPMIDQSQELLPLRRLQHLQFFGSMDISLLLPLLVDHETSLAPIERLGLSLLSKSDSAVACTLLFRLRHTLQTLEIDSPSFHDNHRKSDGMCFSMFWLDWINWRTPGFISSFPFEHMTSLRKFVITDLMFGSRNFRWVKPILQKVQMGGSLEILRFQMWNLKMSYAHTFDWDAVKTISVTLPRLRVIEFELGGGHSASEMRSVVEQKLEGIEKKLILIEVLQ